MAGLLDTLGYVGSALDKPGRAVRGLLAGKGREGLAALPFSDTLGITDPNQATSGRDLLDHLGVTSPTSRGWGATLAGVGTEMALDPTNLIGGAGLRKLARLNLHGASPMDLSAVGKSAVEPSLSAFRGKNISGPARSVLRQGLGQYDDQTQALAWAYGPRFHGGPEKIEDLARAGGHGRTMLDEILNGPHAEQIASEIPRSSSYLGAGAEGVALRAFPGHVVRVGYRVPERTTAKRFTGEIGRARIPEMLQPARSVSYGPYRVEHLPEVLPYQLPGSLNRGLQGWADRVAGSVPEPFRSAAASSSDPRYAAAMGLFDALNGQTKAANEALYAGVKSHGLDFWDTHAANFGQLPTGRSAVLDPGAVWSKDPIDWHGNLDESVIIPPPRGLEHVHLDAGTMSALEKMGAPDAVYEAIRAGVEPGRQGIRVPGTGGRYDLIDKLEAMLAAQQSPGRPSAPNAQGLIDALLGSEPSLGASLPLPKSPPVTTVPGGLSSGLSGFLGDTRTLRLGDDEMRAALGRADPGLNPDAVGGIYSPANDAILMRRGADPLVRREERGHSMVANAVRQGPGSVASLPLAWQPGAWAKYAGGYPEQTGLTQLGRYLDEVAQHSTRQHGFGNQFQGGLSFATDPNLMPAYAKLLAPNNPLLAALMNAPPVAWQNRVPIGLAGLGGAELAKLSRLMDQSNGQPVPF